MVFVIIHNSITDNGRRLTLAKVMIFLTLIIPLKDMDLKTIINPKFEVRELIKTSNLCDSAGAKNENCGCVKI
ncbi:MAG: hypothetical protein ACETVG_00565 [Candidatus Karelsulcia muelleri]